jgi:mannose-6-phosphate isomerase-like protein (cupin superfamily)
VAPRPATGPLPAGLGEVEFWLNETERHVVRAGDCLTFPSSLRHRWRNCGGERLEMLWVNTPITF